MANEFENISTSLIHEDGDIGAVKIADDVIAIIAGHACMEVDGVDSVADSTSREVRGKLGMSKVPKGVQVQIKDGEVYCDISLYLKYGYNIPGTSRYAQEKVKSVIETMTGLTVKNVNLRIAGVAAE
ncbi:MAG: Asp23/Gls24 family envelope stress response protein [Lachnospiraceae bacterium]|nr:Asp23/Gls24 family envelope stress response protein [Lachnospiraceae bacterium]